MLLAELLIVKIEIYRMLKELNLESSERTEETTSAESHFEKQKNETYEFGRSNEEETRSLIEMSRIFATIIYDNWAKEQNHNIAESEIPQQLTKAA
jgi:hypothetical protein